MQTFLPFACFTESAKCLDRQRLGKQRVECQQIVKALVGESKGWVNHPATKMWKDHVGSLCRYWEIIVYEWKNRGYKDSTLVELQRIKSQYNIHDVTPPPWLGNVKFHLSHQSNLLRKNREHYIQYFDVPDNMEYVWP